jgi:hypothetical protein
MCSLEVAPRLSGNNVTLMEPTRPFFDTVTEPDPPVPLAFKLQESAKVVLAAFGAYVRLVVASESVSAVVPAWCISKSRSSIEFSTFPDGERSNSNVSSARNPSSHPLLPNFNLAETSPVNTKVFVALAADLCLVEAATGEEATVAATTEIPKILAPAMTNAAKVLCKSDHLPGV